MVVEINSYYHILYTVSIAPNEYIGCFAKCLSIDDPDNMGGLYIKFVNLKNYGMVVYVRGQTELAMRVTPVSEAFNEYLKLFVG